SIAQLTIALPSESFVDQYLTELLAEHQKLGPFMQVLPICSRVLNQAKGNNVERKTQKFQKDEVSLSCDSPMFVTNKHGPLHLRNISSYLRTPLVPYSEVTRKGEL
ncbi:hypothetical protein RJ640_021959, partial [Escallonia rubra]